MRTVCTFLILITCLDFFAQTWCPPGATWNYSVNSQYVGGNIKGNTIVVFTNTVMIDNKICKTINGSLTGGIYRPFETKPVDHVSWKFIYHTYQENGVLYVYNEVMKNFDTIVNFNASPGDQWFKCFYSGNCDFGRSKLTVTDTGRVIINGMSLKYVDAGQRFVEKLGGVSWFMLAEEDCHVDQVHKGMFVCYQDNEFPLHMREGVRQCLNTVSLSEIENSLSFQLYPNPAEENIQLDLPSDCLVLISNIQGLQLFSQKLHKGMNQLDLQNFPAGVYFINIQMVGINKNTRFVKVQ